MKTINRYFSLLVALVAGLVLTTSCEDQPDKYEIASGLPKIHYVRPIGMESADSLITAAYMNNTICLVGENLRSVTELYFNDKQAILNTSLITDNTLIVTVPNQIPDEVFDKIFLYNNKREVVDFDFSVLVPGPVVASMKNEYARAGEKAVVNGNYFVNDPNVPLTLTIGGQPIEIDAFTLGTITFTVPEGLEEGEVEVATIYGKASSAFHYKDSRGMITNFDGENNSGTKGIVPQGWNLAMTYSDEGGCDGYYAQVGPVDLPANGAWTEALKISWWCGNWGGDPMSITEGPGTPLRNIFPAGYFDKPDELVLKFELCIPSSNPWKAAALQVLFVNNQQCANDTWQNNTYIQTSANGGLDLCRGLYAPWTLTGSYDTGGEWVTVSMPLADFTYNMDGTQGAVPLSPESFDSFTMWPVSGGVEGADCTPILRYDNIRLVPIK